MKFCYKKTVKYIICDLIYFFNYEIAKNYLISRNNSSYVGFKL